MDAHKLFKPKPSPRWCVTLRPLPALLAAGLAILPGTIAGRTIRGKRPT